MLTRSLKVPTRVVEAETGWELKNRQACKGDVCVPLDFEVGETVDIERLSHAMGMPLVAEPDVELWALGPESMGARALSSAECPEIELPDVDGRPFRLSSLRGKKVLLYAWAPY